MAPLNSAYRKAAFLTSAAAPDQFPPDSGFEAAFAGRSNAGKSSALNALCEHHGLARTSKTPGRTRLVNFFRLDAERRLADLPGYGYAKVPEAIKLQWVRLMEDYLGRRESLRGLILLADVRHPLKDLDWQMLDWSREYAMPTHLLLTKADKLKQGPAAKRLAAVRSELDGFDNVSVQLFSALRRKGLERLNQVLDGWLQWSEAAAAEAQKKIPDQHGGEVSGINLARSSS